MFKELLSLLFGGPFIEKPAKPARPLLRIKLTADKAVNQKTLANYLKQSGYTGGDAIVIMSEREFLELRRIVQRRQSNILAGIFSAVNFSTLRMEYGKPGMSDNLDD